MEDYPRTIEEFEARFSSEASCREYLFQLRWPEGFRCPRCGGQESSPVREVLVRCRKCRHQTSVTAGTIFPSRPASPRSRTRALRSDRAADARTGQTTGCG